MANIVEHLINGKNVPGNADRHQDVYNPATGEITKQVALASKATVEEAIAAAQVASPAWRNTSPQKRSQVRFKLITLLEKNANKICDMITSEHGKVFNDAMGELVRAIENVEFACGAPELLKGEHSKNVKLSLK